MPPAISWRMGNPLRLDSNAYNSVDDALSPSIGPYDCSKQMEALILWSENKSENSPELNGRLLSVYISHISCNYKSSLVVDTSSKFHFTFNILTFVNWKNHYHNPSLATASHARDLNIVKSEIWAFTLDGFPKEWSPSV